MKLDADTPVTFKLKHAIMAAVAFFASGNLDTLAAQFGYSPHEAALEARLSDERAGFTRTQEAVLREICGAFPGPIRDPEEPRPEPKDGQ